MARGGMGEIYLAATGDPGFQKFCVIKKMIAEKTDPAKANRFLDEAKVVLRLSHANLVPTFDAGEVEGEFFIAMELVEGKDLRVIWNRCVRTRTRIPLDVALHVGREVARALGYVHSYGNLHLVHRDVAPPNILLSYFGEVKLTDFGLARSVLKQEHTAPGVVFGRASYLAPEQARGEVADARSDIYSLGIVLWELLTGHQYLQLTNVDPATAMSLVRHPRAERASSKAPWIPKELDDLLMRALAPDRSQRFQSAEEMRQALSDVMAKVAPRADVERTAAFVRGLYDNVILEERAEGDRLLAEAQPLFGAGGAGAAGAAVTPPAGVAAGAAAAPRAPLSVHARPTPAVPLAVLDKAKVALAFPREEESLGVDFTGRVIDSRYKVLRKIGEGGMGTVYVGEHVEIGKEVAIKILHPAFSNQQDLVERFRREARAASKIGHPNIIDVTDFGSTEEGCAYFVMEHLDGIDLADILSHERRLEPTRACQIAIQICRALSAAHAAGVVHRDLKPENVFLVSRDGKADFVKVLDFGIARSVGRSRRLTNPGIAMGTPEYMAPEQAQGGVVDQRSDIYSVGALLYEMVTGSPPQQRNGELVAPRVLRNDLIDEIDRTILRALEPDPDRRYQTMTQLEYDIVKGLWGRPRAVNELLGLRIMRRRAETSPQAGERRTDPSLLESITAPAPGLTPGSGLYALERAAGRVPAVTPTSDVIAAASEPAPGGGRAGAGRRFFGTFAAFALASVGAVLVYQRTRLFAHPPISAAAAPAAAAPAPTAPAPVVHPEVAARAQRAHAEEVEIERQLAAGVAFADLPALEGRLVRLRADGGAAVADPLAARAEAALIRTAEGELDHGDIDGGIIHYKLALGLDPRGPSSDALARTLRARAETARAAKHAEEAIRWAREEVALADTDAGAHALLAGTLADARQDEEAAAEYRKALAGAPDDADATRGLAEVEKRIAAGKRHGGHAHRAARSAGRPRGGDDSAAAPGGAADDATKGEAKPDPKPDSKTETSAPSEPASDQQ